MSDEIYHGLSYTLPARSMLQHAPGALVVNSFSKYFSMAGWRLGWLIVPESLIDAARARMGNLFLTPPSLAQHAGLIAFDCRDELEGHYPYLCAQSRTPAPSPSEHGSSAHRAPDEAFYIYADVGHLTNDSLSFCEALLRDTGVAVAPGLDFPIRSMATVSYASASPSRPTSSKKRSGASNHG